MQYFLQYIIEAWTVCAMNVSEQSMQVEQSTQYMCTVQHDMRVSIISLHSVLLPDSVNTEIETVVF